MAMRGNIRVGSGQEFGYGCRSPAAGVQRWQRDRCALETIHVAAEDKIIAYSNDKDIQRTLLGLFDREWFQRILLNIYSSLYANNQKLHLGTLRTCRSSIYLDHMWFYNA